MPPSFYPGPWAEPRSLLDDPVVPYVSGAQVLKLAAVSLFFVWLVRKAGKR